MGNTKRTLRRIIGIALSIVFAIGVLPANSLKSYAATDASVTVNFTVCYDYAEEVLAYVNKERAKYGLSQLVMDQELVNMALQRCADSCVVGEAYDHSEIDDNVAESLTVYILTKNLARFAIPRLTTIRGYHKILRRVYVLH